MKAAWSEVDCRLAITDSPLGSQPEFVSCPHHRDGARSNLAVYANGCFCFSCKFRLGRMETLAFLLYGAWAKEQLDKAFVVAGKYTGEAIDAYRQRVERNTKVDPLPHGLASAYHSMLIGNRLNRADWLLERGLNWGSINYFELGHDGTRFTIPVYDGEGNLRTIRFRRDDYYGTEFFDPKRGEDRPIPKYSGMSGRNGLFLFTSHYLLSRADWVVVVEGELDAIRLAQEGIPAASPTNGAGNVTRAVSLIRQQYPQITSIFLGADMDEPGRLANAEGAAMAVREGFHRVTELSWPEGKDVTEFLMKGYSMKEAICSGDEHSFPTV